MKNENHRKLKKQFLAFLLVFIFIFSIQISTIYLSFNPPNQEIIEYETYYTYEISRDGNHIHILRSTHYRLKSHEADSPPELLPQSDSSVKLAVPVPITEPYQFESTGDQDYLIQPTAFTDDNSAWNTETSAYDWNNVTNAETTASANDANDLDLHTWNTTDNQAEAITYVDIYIRADWSFTGNDYVTVKWYVGSTQGTGTFTMNAANSGDDQIISFENVAEPIDATWSWTDIGNILVEFDEERVAGNDLVYVRIDECWGWVDVAAADTTDPVIDSPADDTYELGSTGNTITWTATDLNPDIWDTTLDLAPHDSGVWVSGVPIVVDIDGLDVGTGYSFVITVYDDSSNWASDTVLIDVEDTTAPIVDSPIDITYEFGSTGNIITWTATDEDPDVWDVTLDLVPYDSGVWVSGVGIDVNIDGLAIGVGYSFIITVEDGSALSDTDTVLVDVEDTTDPVIDSPIDITYELGSTSNTISWTATDLNPNSWSVTLDLAPYDSGVWVSGVPIVVDIDGLDVGIGYSFVMTVDDDYSNSAIDTVLVDVEDTTDPLIDSPADDTYELGSTGNTITWTATDLDADNWEVKLDLAPYDSGLWTTAIPIAVDIDGLDVGVGYSFVITVWDVSNNFVSDTVLITVEDTTNPLIDSPADDTYELGSTSNTIIWTATDLDADDWEVTLDLAPYDSGLWTSGIGISVDIDGLDVGVGYSFVITVWDVSNNFVSDTVLITVEDTTNPLIDSPADDTYELGSTSNTIIWTATDLDADDWDVTLDLSPHDSGSWTSGIGISVNIDGLNVGVGYSFVITVYDVSNNFISDTVLISVEDTTNPLIDSPADDSYIYESTGNTIVWTATDLDADDWEVKLDTVYHDSGLWTTGIGISVNIDGLEIGIGYSFIITVWDVSNNFISDEVLITVTDAGDETDPVIDSPPDDTIELGSTTDDITWTITEINPNQYIVYKNDSNVESGPYSNGVPIVFELDGFTLGIWNCTIWADDDSSNSATDLVWLTVEDTVSPLIDNPPDDSYELGSTGNTIIWTATDLDSDIWEVKLDTVYYDDGSWTSGIGISVNIDALDVGTGYSFVITVWDVSNNFISDTVLISVEDTTDPLIDNPPDDTIELGSTTDDITWTATDLAANTFEVFKNTSSYDSGSWTTSIPIIIELDGITLGLWNMTIVCYDESSNFVIDLVWLTVEDTVSPLIDNPPDDDYLFGSTGNTIIWTATDLDADNFVVEKNETGYDSGSWTTGIGISIDIDGFVVGIFNMTIVCYDSSENFVIDLVWIEVYAAGTDPPLINSPADFSYVEGTLGHSITWIATDLDPDNYTVYSDSIEFINGTWTSGIAIIISVTGLSSGTTGTRTWNITIIVQDLASNTAFDTVLITVSKEDTTPVIPPLPTTTPTSATPLGEAFRWIILILVIVGLSCVVFTYYERRK